ncbi:Ribonuclease H-like domain,Domain of unknown function DUF659, partial [Cinara cedri]
MRQQMPRAALLLQLLSKTNHSTICSLFENSLYLLWPDGIRRNDVLLFLSDAAPYMVKAGDTLKVLYPKMVHVTCTSHGLHRVAEQIRIQFPKVDKLVANVKRVFKKAPYRVQKFHTDAPNISLPPEPILTRWGTWISAVLYYSENFQTVKNIIESFDENDALSIKNAQKYFKITQMKGNLTFIHSNFACLPIAITRLQKQGIPLSEVLNKNKGFQIVCNISKILTGEEENVGDLDIPEDLTSSDMAYFKFAPITSADVERSFSLYKNILAPNRRSFKFENLKKSLIVQCNNYFRGTIKIIKSIIVTKRKNLYEGCLRALTWTAEFENLSTHLPHSEQSHNYATVYVIMVYRYVQIYIKFLSIFPTSHLQHVTALFFHIVNLRTRILQYRNQKFIYRIMALKRRSFLTDLADFFFFFFIAFVIFMTRFLKKKIFEKSTGKFVNFNGIFRMKTSILFQNFIRITK